MWFVSRSTPEEAGSHGSSPVAAGYGDGGGHGGDCLSVGHDEAGCFCISRLHLRDPKQKETKKE